MTLGRFLHRPAFWLDAIVKAGLIGLLLLAGLRPDLPQFEGKAMAGRALTYPIAALIVPIGWWIAHRRRRGGEYPFALDILLVLPFLIDVIGNAADLYDSISWWDDANHLVNWALLTAAFGSSSCEATCIASWRRALRLDSAR